ncbi:hypothetical protein [Thiomicrorhabdus aquaedulcis]|uniref:hypothetical protein n=1 Tax=Thiomicrorhabdus aquaedulcis TaxID=2211106 RepID=UPI0018807B7E|nr:hypothetical protein [Thiomicrorhabdus aquaedulcis]
MAFIGYDLTAKQIQEVILILNLSVAQIELSIQEGDHSIENLLDSFKYMVNRTQTINNIAHQMTVAPNTPKTQCLLEKQADLKNSAQLLTQNMNRAIVSFQFYDRLTQRLKNVSKGLSGLADIIAHQMQVKDVKEWERFKEQIRKNVSMREERELFDLVFEKHIPAEQAIEIVKQRMIDRRKDHYFETELVDQDFTEVEFF